MELENISGHPRSFTAAYAKDIVVAKIEQGSPSIEADFHHYADMIYDWVMQDQLKPVTDAQLWKIEELLFHAGLDDEEKYKCRELMYGLTVGEASKLINELQESQIPLKDRFQSFTQKEIMRITRERAERDT